MLPSSAPLDWPPDARNIYVRAGKDVIGLAQTGAGKTGAFALPILQVRLQQRSAHRAAPHASRLHRCQALLDKPQPFFALVLSPTRELALQISGQARCEWWRLLVRADSRRS